MTNSIFFSIRYSLIVLITFAISACSLSNDIGGKQWDGDVDLSKAIPLVAQVIPHPYEVENTSTPADEFLPHDLFALSPDASIALAKFSGAIDPVGTSLDTDFDGDGILNEHESTTNIWVADYPRIETTIATPVTLEIEILKEDNTHFTTLSSDITTADTEKNSQHGSDTVHRNEVNVRTVQFQDSYSQEHEGSGSFARSLDYSAKYSYTLPYVGGSGGGESSLNLSENSSWSNSSGYSKTTTDWADKPFRNNLDSEGWSRKSSSSAQTAQKYRQEKSEAEESTIKIESNAGFVRAALFIKNNSVNMPVHISNILCSLMFETPSGELIPMQSFRLRNSDYTLFEIDVYGDSKFGPYVVELNNLNTAEVENALRLGYNPKIFVVDYEMTHVADSNYRSSILQYTGDNLKIVEENAKGRTSLLKVFGPGMRNLFRIAAFNATIDGSSEPPAGFDICSSADWDSYKKTSSVFVSPGVSLKNAMKRLKCSGVAVEFENYIIDLSEEFPKLKDNTYFIKGIKSIGGIQNSIPCEEVTDDSGQVTACRQIPASQWTPEQRESAGMWAIFAQGKYYTHTEFLTDPVSGLINTFDITTTTTAQIPMAKGIDSMIWAGDHYDLIYITYADLLAEESKHGTNPLETGEKVVMNTRWNTTDVHSNTFHPAKKSVYLGQIGFGEVVELRFKLLDNQFLFPSFGSGYNLNESINIQGSYYNDFSYNFRADDKRFYLDEVSDLELSLGVGGNRTDWLHIRRDVDFSITDPFAAGILTQKLMNCGTTFDYVLQEFYLCLRMPTDHALVDPAHTLINLYIRPALNNAYRETAWPVPTSEIRRFRGELRYKYSAGTFNIRLKGTGDLEDGDILHIGSKNAGYDVTVQVDEANSNPATGYYLVSITPGLSADHDAGEEIYVDAGLVQNNVKFVYEDGYQNWTSYTFDEAWNSVELNPDIKLTPESQYNLWYHYLDVPLSSSDLSTSDCGTSLEEYHPQACLGYRLQNHIANWAGGYNYGVPRWNAWSESTSFITKVASTTEAIPYAETSGVHMRIDGYDPNYIYKDKFPISSNTLGEQHKSKIVVSGDYAMVVWHSEHSGKFNIYGRVYNMKEQTAVTPQFMINTTTGYHYRHPVMASDGNTVLVAWESGAASGPDVRGRIFYLPDGTPAGDDFKVSNAPNQSERRLAIAAGNGKAMVVWETHNGTNYDIKGKILDLTNIHATTGAPASISAPEISTRNTNEQSWPQVALFGDRALVVWESKHNGTDRNINGRFYVLSSGAPLNNNTSDFTISTTNAGEQRNPQVVATANQAMVIWENASLQVRVYDMLSGNALNNSTSDFAIAPAYQFYPRAAVSNNRIIVTWTNYSGGVEGRVYNTNSQSFMGPRFTLNHPSAAMALDYGYQSVSVDNNLAVVAWPHYLFPTHSGGPPPAIYGFGLRVVDLNTGTPLGIQFGSKADAPKRRFNFDYENYSLGYSFHPELLVALSDHDALVVWQPADYSDGFGTLYSDIWGSFETIRRCDIPQFSKECINNFFTSPLIERSYELNATVGAP